MTSAGQPIQVPEFSSGDLVAVTPNDSTPIATARYTRGVYIGSIASGATMTVVTRAGQTVEFTGLVAGSILPIQVAVIKSSGTLASGLIALF